MHKQLKKVVWSLTVVVVGLGVLHQWQSGGFDELGLFSTKSTDTKFRVGFLPVT